MRTTRWICAAIALVVGCGGAECAVDTDCVLGQRCNTDNNCVALGETDAGDVGIEDTGGADEGADAPVMDTAADVEPDTGPMVDLMFCTDVCAEDSDCTLSEMDLGFACVDERCTPAPADGCTDDLECIAQFSGWSVACAEATPCAFGQCAAVGEGGLCAFEPVDGACTAPTEMLTVTTILGAEVTVCGQPRAACEEDVCRLRCSDDTHCEATPLTPICDVESGSCVCTMDEQCAMAEPGVGVSVCMDGRCGCAGDDDCAEVANADVCVEGSCGCSEDSVCEREPGFDGTTVICGS